MMSADWYFAQAGVLRGRADACRQLADQLAGAQLFELHRYSGEATWQGPVAVDFDEQLAAHCRRLHEAIDRLRSNVIALGVDADDLERHGVHLLELQHAAGGDGTGVRDP